MGAFCASTGRHIETRLPRLSWTNTSVSRWRTSRRSFWDFEASFTLLV